MASTQATGNGAGRVSDTAGMTSMQKMARTMWAPMLHMGFMIVAASFIVGAVNSATVADFLGADKATREGAAAGTSLVDKRVTIEGIKSLLPGFKFLSMGLLLAGITYLVSTILGTLRHLGTESRPPWAGTLSFPRHRVKHGYFP